MNPQQKTFGDLKTGQEFTNGTGVTFKKENSKEAVIVEAYNKLWLIGSVYRFARYGYVEVEE